MLYTSGAEYDETMHLLLYRRHFMYIKDFDSVAKRFQCRNCEKLFTRSSKCCRHEKTCVNATREKFPGGFFSLPPTIFERLMEQGISVPDEDRFFSHFVCFDMEAMLLKEKREVTENLTWTHKHRAISVSVNSNVPGFTSPHCFVNPDQNALIQSTTDYMREIRDESNRLMKEKWDYVFRALENQRLPIEERKKNENYKGGGA
jgi:hypothetical protein